MYHVSPKAQSVLARLMQQYAGLPVQPEHLNIIAVGGSGRAMMRCSRVPGCIGIYWTAERADNNSYLPAAHGLARLGIRVPAILAEAQSPEQGCGACLVQDLGTQDILSLKTRDWTARKNAYCQAIQAVHSLHTCTPTWSLQPAFDAALYRWEQHYFAEHYLHTYCGQDPTDFLQQSALISLTEYLASLPVSPIHRDFQSQNIMLHDNQAWLIDFQGMRLGRPEYDMASLLLDPYMELSTQEQAELLTYWEHIRGTAIDRTIYAACALQRIMQALGAYANIGLNQHKEWYINLIPAGLKSLKQAMNLAPAGSPPAQVAACLQAVL